MRKYLFTAFFTLLALTATAQGGHKGKPHISPEEFKNKQKEFITRKADLTTEEADAFFPLYFELQKKKFELERNARKESKKPRGEKMTEEECRAFAYRMADNKIEIAKLEREYTDKYLKVISACKLQRVMFAEGMFQRHLMKEMMHHKGNKKKPADGKEREKPKH